MDVDQLLNYEKECYELGFQEGAKQGRILGHAEGREFGLQTGYFRYLSMGVLQARASIWEQESQTEEERAAIDVISKMVESPGLENKPDIVDAVDRNIKLAKNKCNRIAVNRKSPKLNIYAQRIVHRGENDEATAIEDMY